MAVVLKISKVFRESLIMACVGALLVFQRVEGASTTQGSHFVFQVPYLQEPNGHVVVSMITSWHRSFTVWVTAPSVLKDIDGVVWLHRKQPLTLDLKNMFSNQIDVKGVTMQSDPKNMFAVFICVIDTRLSIETFPLVPVAAFSTNYYISTFKYNPLIIVLTAQRWSNIIIRPRWSIRQDCYLIGIVSLSVFYEIKHVKVFESCNRTTYTQRQSPRSSSDPCAFVTTPDLSYTGVVVEGDKCIGMIAGNSRTFANATPCNNGSLNDDRMTAAYDSVLHNSWYGTTYILPHIPFRAGTRVVRVVCMSLERVSYPVQVNITTTAAATNSSINNNMRTSTMVKLMDSNDEYLPELPEGHHMLTSSAPVQCHYAVLHTCDSPGSMAYSIIVPFDQGYFSYVWTSPNYEDFQPVNFIMLILRRSDRSSLQLDNGNITDSRGDSVSGEPGLVVLSMPVAAGPHDLYSTSQSPFLCYLYGYEANRMYLHPAGYLVSGVTQANPVWIGAGFTPQCPYPQGTIPVDLVDDDCDGKLDEEVKNGIDDDMDGLVDEDIRTPVRVHGGWSVWSSWLCPSYCTDDPPTEGTLERSKSCNNNTPTVDGETCLGDDRETRTDECDPTENCELAVGQWGYWTEWSCLDLCASIVVNYYEQRQRACNKGANNSECVGVSSQQRKATCVKKFICPADCPDMTFGNDCNGSCPNCVEPCNKHTGFCRQCEPGYFNRSTGCSSVCPFLTFGNFCAGICPKKCRMDCVDRINGTCPAPLPNYTMTIILITWPLSVIPLIYLCYIIIKVHTNYIVSLEEE